MNVKDYHNKYGEMEDERKANEKTNKNNCNKNGSGSEKDFNGEMFYGENWDEFNDYYIEIGAWPASGFQTESKSDSEFRVLNFLESGTTISILEDLFQEILILKHIIEAPVTSSWNFDYKTLDDRFESLRVPEKLFPEMDNIPVLTTPVKLQRDRQFIENIVRDTLKTLLDDGTFEPVIKAAHFVKQKLSEEQNLMQEIFKNIKYLKDIKDRVQEKMKQEDKEEKQRDEFLYKLQDEIDDEILKCSIDKQFVDKWENIRNKQNQWRLKNIEHDYRRKIYELNRKSILERRVNEEIQTYTKKNQMELEEQLEEWMARYDAEMERRENKILQLKYTKDQSEEEIKRLQNLYAIRKTEIIEWLKFREIRRRRTAASLIIQSWWRGFMVREKLGPYKEKKQKTLKLKKKKKTKKVFE